MLVASFMFVFGYVLALLVPVVSNLFKDLSGNIVVPKDSIIKIDAYK